MKTTRIIAILALVAGVVSGPFVLESARAARPPTGWFDVAWNVLGATILVVVVAGVHSLRRNLPSQPSNSALVASASLYFIASGVTAGLMAAHQGSSVPAPYMNCSLGIGALIGAGLCRVIFRD